LGKPKVSVIKIDIEGGETSALKGATSIIEACRPYIVFEWNPINLLAYGITADKIFSLVPDGYQLLSIPFLTEVREQVLALELLRSEMFLLAPVSREQIREI
jgi:hypothetical protein